MVREERKGEGKERRSIRPVGGKKSEGGGKFLLICSEEEKATLVAWQRKKSKGAKERGEREN